MVLSEHIPLTKTQASAVLIGFVFAGKLYGVLAYGADFALFPDLFNQLFCPAHCWTFPTSIPYSVFWTWINPLWLGRFWYGVYIITFDALTCLGYWKIKRIPKMYLALLQAMSIWFYLGQGSEYQNVTIFACFPLMFLANGNKIKLGLLAALPIVIKLPLGWSLPWVINDHVRCVYACSGFARLPSLYSLFANVILDLGILMYSWYWTLFNWVLPKRQV